MPLDHAEAFKWLRRAAEAGCPQAQHALGGLYHDGLGCRQDSLRAEVWFRRAFEEGIWEAGNNLAAMLARRGDVAGAADIWASVAEEGEPNAQCNLGMCYMRGLGREPDPARAKEWLEKAVAQGHQMAADAITTL